MPGSLVSRTLHVITVATHAEGYFPTLLQSAALLGIKIHILGWGKKWSSYDMKFRLVLTFCRTTPPDDVVMFVDGFDAVILQPPDVIMQRFLNLNVPFIASAETTTAFMASGWFLHFALDAIFVESDKIEWPDLPPYACPKLRLNRINSGSWIGFSGRVVEILEPMPPSVVNDQKWLTNLYVKGDHRIIVDSRCELFHVYRTRGSVDLLPFEEAVKKYPYTLAKSKDTVLTTDDKRAMKRGQTQQTPFLCTLADRQTQQIPCVIHMNFRRNVNGVMRRMGLMERYGSWLTSWFWYIIIGLRGTCNPLYAAFLLSTIFFIIGIVSSLIFCILLLIPIQENSLGKCPSSADVLLGGLWCLGVALYFVLYRLLLFSSFLRHFLSLCGFIGLICCCVRIHLRRVSKGNENGKKIS